MRRIVRIYRDEMVGPNGSVLLILVGVPEGRDVKARAAFLDFDGPRVEEFALNDRPPYTQLEPGEAQALADDLWRAGVKPSEAAGSAGQLAAVERHLADARSVAQMLLTNVLGILEAMRKTAGGDPTK